MNIFLKQHEHIATNDSETSKYMKTALQLAIPLSTRGSLAEHER